MRFPLRFAVPILDFQVSGSDFDITI